MEFWKGLSKLLAPASADCSLRWELGWEAVVADTAARREAEVVAEVGRVCRVQLRRAALAVEGAGRIAVVGGR